MGAGFAQGVFMLESGVISQGPRRLGVLGEAHSIETRVCLHELDGSAEGALGESQQESLLVQGRKLSNEHGLARGVELATDAETEGSATQGVLVLLAELQDAVSASSASVAGLLVVLPLILEIRSEACRMRDKQSTDTPGSGRPTAPPPRDLLGDFLVELGLVKSEPFR
jgi:hypothetical protein